MCATNVVPALLCAATLALTMSGAVAQDVNAPDEILKAGKIVFCTSIPNPPLEFNDANNNLVGAEAELGTEIARRFGVQVEWANTQFDGIIPALQARHCDAILAQLFDKPARREVVNFVDLMYSSQALLVAKGNPKHVRVLADLSGVKVAASNGTTIQALVEAQNKKFQAAGKPPAILTVFPQDVAALQALQTGQVDVFGTTLETASYYVTKMSDTVEVAGPNFGKILSGIAIRKDDQAMADAIQKAVDTIRKDGTELRILTKWHLEADAF